MEFIKKVIHVSAIISYLFILLYLVVCIPLIFGRHPIVVLSGSMEETYKVGSVIYYKKVLKEDLKVGDVITYKDYNNDIVSHRIVSINNDFIKTKGDANDVVDVYKVYY